jgi:hypothetical protein
VGVLHRAPRLYPQGHRALQDLDGRHVKSVSRLQYENNSSRRDLAK